MLISPYRPASRLPFTALVLCLSSCASAQSNVTNLADLSPKGDRWAVLVSVEDYPEPTSDLEGPANDMKVLAEILGNKYGFSRNQILRLHGPEATRKAILDALAGLKKRAGKDKIVVFAFAGHGSYRDNPVEANRRDETICPVDRGEQGGGEILDDELNTYFGAILERHALLTVLVDACHSGSLLKDVPAGTRFRFAPPSQTHQQQNPPQTSASLGTDKLERLVFLAAAQEDQLAGETFFSGKQGPRGNHGKFSHALLYALENAKPGQSWSQLAFFIKKQVRARSHHQNPVFIGNLDRQVFGKHLVRTQAPTRVTGVSARQIVVDRGKMGGITEKSLLAVYSPIAPDSKVGLKGYYKVNECEVRSATARLEGQAIEGASPVKVGDVVVLLVPGDYARKHALFWDRDLPASLAADLRKLIAGERLLMAGAENGSPDAQDFHLKVGLAKGQKKLFLGGTPTPFSWPLPLENPRAVSEFICERIPNTIRWMRLRDFENPNPRGFDAEKLVTVRLERGAKKRRRSPFSPLSDLSGSAGAVHVRDGDILRLSYTNISDQPLFITAFFLNNQSEILPWNMEDYAEKLEAGGDRPYVVKSDYVRIHKPAGRAYLKIFVATRSPFEPRTFSQRNVKSDRAKAWLQAIFWGEKGAKRAMDAQVEDWGTITIPVQSHDFPPAPQ